MEDDALTNGSSNTGVEMVSNGKQNAQRIASLVKQDGKSLTTTGV